MQATYTILIAVIVFLAGCASSNTNVVQPPTPTPTSTPLPTPTPTPGPATEFLYTASMDLVFGAGNLGSFQIDSLTHTLTAMTGASFNVGFPASTFPIGLVTDKTREFLLTAISPPVPGSTTVQSYKRNSDGSFTRVTSMAIAGLTPVAIAMDPQNRFFYVVGEGTTPVLSVLSLDHLSGSLTLVSSFQLQPTVAGPFGLCADSSGNFLYVSLSDATPGVAGIAELSVHADGTITQNGIAPMPGTRFPGPGLFANASNVYAGNGTGGIYAFSIAGVSGALTPVAGSPFSTNTESVLAFSQFGSFLYAGTKSHQISANPLVLDPATLFAFQIQNGGALQPVQGSPFQPAVNSQCLTVLNSFLYVGDQSSVQGFSIDTSTGKLTSVFTQSNLLSNLGCVTAP